MSKYKIKSGKGELVLKKSKSLVGLKTSKKRSADRANYVKEYHLPNLGGFKVVSLNKKRGVSLDDQLDEVRREPSVEIGTHVYFAEGSNKPMIPTGDIIITFQSGVDEEEQMLVLDEFHLELVERCGNDIIIAKVTKKSKNPIKVASLLQKASLIKVAEPDLDMLLDEYLALPNDRYMPEEWHLKNDGFIEIAGHRTVAGADAKVVDAWNRMGSLGSSNIVVAVIDNGFDISHPDLKHKVFRPWDLWTQSDRLTAGDITFTHGTPCASLAVAASDGNGMVGVAPKAKFMPISGTSFSTDATRKMFDYCIKNGADVISCSWGTTKWSYALNALKEQAIAKAAREGRNGKGCVILYAAGNEGLDYVNLYATHPDVICVAASDSKDRHSRYSNQGMEVSICAPSNGDWPLVAARAHWDPGTHLRGDGVWRYWADGIDRPGPYKHFGGTSAATPVVAGICALMLSVNPDLTAKQVKEILQNTADKIGSPSEYINGHSRKYGYGRVNADKAVARARQLKDGTTGTVVNEPSEVEDNVAAGQGLFRFAVERQAPEGYGVQVGVYAEYANVLIAAEKLQRQFAETIVVNINELNGKTVYKVIVGAYPGKRDANSLHRDLKAAGINGFVKNLKAFA